METLRTPGRGKRALVLAAGSLFVLIARASVAFGFGGDGIGTMPSKAGILFDDQQPHASFGVEGRPADLARMLLGVAGAGTVDFEMGERPGTQRVWFHGALRISLDRRMIESGRLRTVVVAPELFGRGVFSYALEGCVGAPRLEAYVGSFDLPMARISASGLIDLHALRIRATSQEIRASCELRVRARGSILEISLE